MLRPHDDHPQHFDRDKVGTAPKQISAMSGLLSIGFLIYWFSRPKRQQELEEPKSFSDALQDRAHDIMQKCKTPREIRRFLNYLRLVVTPAEDQMSDSIQSLRAIISSFDADLVTLATKGISQSGDVNQDCVDFFKRQCELFGLDPETFAPIQ